MRFNLTFPADKPFDVVGMGLNSVDFLVLLPEYPASNSKIRIRRVEKSGGGQVATALVGLSRWGTRTKYIGKVGGDERVSTLSNRFARQAWKSLLSQ